MTIATERETASSPRSAAEALDFSPSPEPARPEDVEPIAALLAASAPETIPLSREEVRADLERFLVLRSSAGAVVAVAALHEVGDGRIELRSVAVDSAWRGRGLGRTLVRRLLEQVVAAGRQLFCYTFRPGFFARLGFRSVPAQSLPQRRGRPSALDGRPRLAMAATPLSLRPRP